MQRRFYCTLGILLIVLKAYSQQTIVTGKVTEATTGSPIPFANVIFTGTQEGTTTDFDGNFILKTSSKIDSIEVRYVGFYRRSKPVQVGTSQVVNMQLEEDVVALGEVIIYAGENPAFEILRRVNDHKKLNDKRSLEAYEFESYTKIEFDIDQIPEKLKKRKIYANIAQVMDSIEQIAGEDGKTILPVFLSEAISRYYYRRDPRYRHEHVLKTKISGVGITDGTTSSQIIGASFQQYNFYENWMTIISKEFISPIADVGRLYYEYELVDSSMVDGDFCYRIDFWPKRSQDLAFIGSMSITRAEYALKRIDAAVAKDANINFIEKMKIQQDLVKTEAGPWLPQKTRVVVDAIQLTNFTGGVLAKFYVSTKDYVVNQPKPKEFYINPVSMDEGMRDSDESYWAAARHDSLTSTEVNVFEMIDTLKNIPLVKYGMNLAKFAFSGYYRVGKIDIGPYSTFYGNNNIEGSRVGFGARTNYAFSDKWTFGGHVGYGFGDDRWKYRAYVDRVLSRQPWSNITLEHVKEVEQIWLLNQNLDPKGLFYSLSRFGTLTQPFVIEKNRVNYSRQLGAGISAKVGFKHQQFEPLYGFQYYQTSDKIETGADFSVSEVSASLRYAKDEIFIIDDNTRSSLGLNRWPAFTLDYTYGIDGLLGSDFTYHKFRFSFEKRQKISFFGISNIKLSSGYIAGDIPYPLLYNPIGNRTPVYVDFAYNLMDFFEFSTDKYIELRYRHSFEGLFLNGIPLLKKLKLRELASVNLLYGSVSNDKLGMTVAPTNSVGEPDQYFTRLDGRPYIELGYGVENIFRLVSIQAFHRITYLESPDVRKFGIKFKVEFNL